MAGVTTNTAANAVLTTWLNKKFIRDLEFTLQHQKFTVKAVIPRGAGNVGRYIAFSPPTKPASYSTTGSTALAEGTTNGNEITTLGQTSINITPAEFGEFIKVSNLYEYVSVAGTREKMLKRLKDGAAYSMDSFVRSKTVTTTNSLFAETNTVVGGSSSAPTGANTTGRMNAALLILARRELLEDQAMGFDDLPKHPRGHFAAVLTPKQELDIVTEVTTGRIYWSNAVVNVPGAMGQEKFINGYIGSIYQVAVYITNNYTTATVSTAADIGFVYSDGGVGSMSLGDMDPKIILNDVNSPYKNLNSFAWHTMFDAALIDGNRVVKLYSNSTS